MRASFENVIITSKKQAKLIGTDCGKELFKKIITDLLSKTYIRRYSRYTSLELFSQKGLIVLSEIFSKNPPVKAVMLTGLMYCPQQRNNKMIEYILLLN